MQFFLLICVSLSLAFDPSRYEQHIVMSDVYTLHYTLVEDAINVAIVAKTTGWVGLGIGEFTSGSMAGADFLTGMVLDDGSATIQDRYLSSKTPGKPAEDLCQDWTLEGYEEDQAEEVTVIEASRLLDTGDTQDRAIQTGQVRLLWAVGGTDTFDYHGASHEVRGLDVEIFMGTRPKNETWPGSVPLLHSGAVIPPQVTTYMCEAYVLPDVDAHIVSIEPVIDPESAPFVHHFTIQACDWNGTTWRDFIDSPALCTGAVMGDCQMLVYAWGPGIGELQFPPEAGLRMGSAKDYGARAFVLETHYDNPTLVDGVIDHSGVVVHYTPELRTHDAGIFALGDSMTSFPDIPPGEELVAYMSDCPSECTSRWPHSITVIASFLHMHLIGSRMWTNRWPHGNNEGAYDQINRVDYYDFNLQQNTMMPAGTMLHPGDRLSTHCEFDSRGRSDPTNFGTASHEEMCMDFVTYYPIVFSQSGHAWRGCGYLGGDTACGWMDPEDMPNPTLNDPNHTASLFYGAAPEVCPAPPPEPTPEGGSGWHGLHDGAKAGIVVSCLLVFAAAVVGGVVFVRRSREKRYQKF